MIRRLLKLGILLTLVVIGYFGVTFVQVWQAARRDASRPAGAIIVLGAAQYNGTPSPVLKARLDHAAELYEADIADVVVLTGGRQEGDRFTEASASAGYLMRAGIPEADLRLESDGKNTWESLAAAARFLRAEGITSAVLVSSPYHSMRVGQIAGEVGLEAHVSPATDAPDGATFDHLTHETLAVGLGRIFGYHRLVDLDDKVGKVRSTATNR